MSKFNNKKVIPRYMAIAIVMTFIGVAVIGKALYIMTAKKQYWTEVADRLKRDSVSVKPNRGNILSCDGQLMATSIPEYKIFMDFQEQPLRMTLCGWTRLTASVKDCIKYSLSVQQKNSSNIWRQVVTKSIRMGRWELATGLYGLGVSTIIPIWKSDSCRS